MPEECIICLENENLFKVECNECNGIYIHSDCYRVLLNNSGTKCPHCRGTLKNNNNIPDIDVDTDLSTNSDEENRYIDQHILEVIRENNRINANSENRIMTFKQLIQTIAFVMIFLTISYIIGALFVYIYCLIVENCQKNTNKIMVNPYYMFLKFFVGIFILSFICINLRDIAVRYIMRRITVISNLENSRNRNPTV
tara:strand:+ start:907 stop:1497 length:591 start_codon:yes stop_codon:yes gene_type:complete